MSGIGRSIGVRRQWRLAVLCLLTAILVAGTASASTIWTFDLPGTAIASQTPPYPVVATLTLTQTVDGVQFVLDPNQNSPGFLANGDDSFVEQIDYVYAGPALSASHFPPGEPPQQASSGAPGRAGPVGIAFRGTNSLPRDSPARWLGPA